LLIQRNVQDDVEHQKKADHIVDTVLNLMDKNSDGKISMDELKVVGLDGLPNFEDLGAEGHHYDEESGMSKLLNYLV
jgi:nucleobindin